jgi:DNA repair protein RecO
MEIKTEGILLSTLDFQERHEIVTIFGRESGIVKGIRKFAKGKKKIPLAPPFCCDFVLIPGRGDLYGVAEEGVKDTFPKLRERWESLEAAFECLEALKKWEGGSSLIYDLLKKILHHIPKASDPYVLSSMFLVKLLLHEGLIHPKEDEKWLYVLAYSRSFKDLESLAIDPDERNLIKKTFSLAIF